MALHTCDIDRLSPPLLMTHGYWLPQRLGQILEKQSDNYISDSYASPIIRTSRSRVTPECSLTTLMT